MKIYEAEVREELLDTLIAMSGDWEAEQSTYGYRKNDRSDIEGNRIFVAEREGRILGYLFGQTTLAERSSSVMDKGTACFEVEELYVVPRYRSQGIGRALFVFAEEKLREEGVRYLLLSTATKNYQRILHFYIDEMGMEFWSARLYKKLH